MRTTSRNRPTGSVDRVSVPPDVRLRALAHRIDRFDEGRPGLAWIAGFFTSLVMMGGLLDKLRWPMALGVPLGLTAGVAVGMFVHFCIRALTNRWKRQFIALAESAHMPRAEVIKYKRT